MGIPSIDIYRNRETGSFVLLSYAEESEFGFNVGYGSMLKVSDPEMIKKGLDIILKDFQEYPLRKRTQPAEIELFSKRERRKFNTAHKNVCISLINDDSQLRIYPMFLQSEGGYMSKQDTFLVVILPSTNQEFYEKLNQAIALCD